MPDRWNAGAGHGHYDVAAIDARALRLLRGDNSRNHTRWRKRTATRRRGSARMKLKHVVITAVARII